MRVLGRAPGFTGGGKRREGRSDPRQREIYEGSYYTWLAYLAQVQGFFAKNGLAAHVVGVTGGGPVAFAALASGTGDVAMGDLTLAGPFLEKGVDLTAIAGAVKAGWEVVAASGVSLPTSFPASVRALAGKPVGVVSLGSSSYYYMRGLVTAAGLPPDTVTYAALGGVPANAVSALDADRVEVATASDASRPYSRWASPGPARSCRCRATLPSTASTRRSGPCWPRR